jgi:hypothetical protein
MPANGFVPSGWGENSPPVSEDCRTVVDGRQEGEKMGNKWSEWVARRSLGCYDNGVASVPRLSRRSNGDFDFLA